MEVEVVSKFYWYYFFKGILGTLILGIPTFFLDVMAILGYLYWEFELVLLVITLNILSSIFIYIFLGGWKKITVGPSGIIVDYLISSKQILIPYDSITAIYRPVYNLQRSKFDTGVTSNTLIEYNNTSFTFKPDYYTNYTELRAAIYNYKYGFDRQRLRY